MSVIEKNKCQNVVPFFVALWRHVSFLLYRATEEEWHVKVAAVSLLALKR